MFNLACTLRKQDYAGKKAGEFYTPRQVSRVLAKLVAPQEGEKIADPACGSGSLLIEAAQEVGSKNVSLVERCAEL
jgi:type I restriction enzyme M protein